MYVGVPINWPLRVIMRFAGSASLSLATPKSRILARSPPGASRSGTRNKLSGLRSRWTMPAACVAASEPDLARDPQRFGRRQRDEPVQPRAQRLAVEKLHHDERDLVVGEPEVVDLDDPG